ncbi:hypothetical protein B0H14DRAFT_3442431 [Mycena olivaceomarginata]|nr:hypothetical protein B0H14DRAFT_3442431 [Mycena olivaceomarginata]
MSLPALDSITGALLIGTWANSFLYAAELYQARDYFRHFQHDDWKLKTLVWIAFLFDTICTVGDYAWVYLYTITHAGDPVYLTGQPWTAPLHLFTSAMVAILYAGVSLFAHCIILSVRREKLGGSFAVGVVTALFPAFKDREKVAIPVLIWLVTEAVVDINIAATLLWQLRKARPNLVETRSVLDRLVTLTIQTGTATVALSVGGLVAFFLKKESNVPVGMVYTLGRVYMLSMLANLNIRRSGRSAPVDSGGASSGALGSLTLPSYVLTDDFATADSNGRIARSHFHEMVRIGPKEYVTFTSSCARNIHNDSRPAGSEVMASHSPQTHNRCTTRELTVLNIEELPLGVFLSLFRAAPTLALRGVDVVQDDLAVSECAPRAASRLVRLSIAPVPHPSPFLPHPDYASLTSSLTHLAIQMGNIKNTQLLRNTKRNTSLRRRNSEVLWALDHISSLPALRSIDYAGRLLILAFAEIFAQFLALLMPVAFPRPRRITVTFYRSSIDTFLPSLKADPMRRLDAALAVHPAGPYLTFRGQSKPFGSLFDNFGCEAREALPLMYDSGRVIFEREGYGYRNWMRGHGDPSGL